jgi:DNA-binding GntR family transcriptional regulator
MRIAATLRTRILTGELSRGDAMPSTKQLAQEYGVSIETALKALHVLADEELIRRWPGLPYVVL